MRATFPGGIGDTAIGNGMDGGMYGGAWVRGKVFERNMGGAHMEECTMGSYRKADAYGQGL